LNIFLAFFSYNITLIYKNANKKVLGTSTIYGNAKVDYDVEDEEITR